MKKHIIAWLLLAALLLTGCGGRKEPPAPPQAPQPEVQAPADPVPPQEPAAPAPETPEREEKGELTFLLEGMEETVPVTLYTGDGYSIYIPDEGWRLEEDVDDRIREECWESTQRDDVELRVLHLGDMTLEEAQDWMIREEDDYRLIEDKQGGLYGEDREAYVEIRFFSGGGRMYAVAWKYPSEAAEGFGTRLGVLADTFEVTL